MWMIIACLKYHWSTSITIRIETIPSASISRGLMHHWSTSITIRIETLNWGELSKRNPPSLKYIHYNKDWDISSLPSDQAGFNHHWSTSITIRIETINTFASSTFSPTYHWSTSITIRIETSNKFCFVPILIYHWSTSITIRIETLILPTQTFFLLFIIEVHPLQ